MNLFLIFIFGVVAGGVGMWLVFKFKTQTQHPYKPENIGVLDKETGLIERQSAEKERNKEAILGLLETQGSLTNNHIEQMLGISDATATRYLEELEKEGLVRQVGNTGSGVYYERTN